MRKKSIISIKEEDYIIKVNQNFLNNLIESAIAKTGKVSKLSEILIKIYKLKRYDQKSLSDNLRKWQKNRDIGLNYYLVIGDFLQEEKNKLYSKINYVKLRQTRNGLKLKFPFEITPDWCYLSEAIKVEGTLNRKRVIFENTDTALTKKVKEKLINIGIEKEKIRESLHIRIQVPKKFEDKNLKIFNEINKKKVNNFYSRILKLKRGNKKSIIFSLSHFEYNKKLTFKVYHKNKFLLQNDIFIPKQGKILFFNSLKDERYKKGCVSLRIEVGNKTLSYILNDFFKIPYGKKTRSIYIPTKIKELNKDCLRNLISIVIDSEAGFSNNMAICSLSKKYLLDFQEILLRFNITSKISGNLLKIYGKRNLIKIKENFEIFSKNKADKLEQLIVKGDKSPKGMSLSLYLQSLNKLKVATWIEIRNNANRSGNSSRKYRDKLLEKKLIREVKLKRPRTYEITKQGQNFLNENEIYWL